MRGDRGGVRPLADRGFAPASTENTVRVSPHQTTLYHYIVDRLHKKYYIPTHVYKKYLILVYNIVYKKQYFITKLFSDI